MTPRLLAAGLALALAPSAGPPPAAQEVQVDLDDLQVVARPLWSALDGPGWVPVRVHVENDGERDRDVLVGLQSYYAREVGRVERRFVAPAGTSVDLDLVVPARLSGYGFFLEVEAGGDRSRSYGGRGGFVPGGTRAYLWVSDADTAPGELERWGAALATAEIKSRGSPLPNVVLAQVRSADLPGRPDAYTGVSGVLVDADSVPPRAVAPLASYARAGGTLAIVGLDAERWAAGIEGVGEWVEPRFSRERDGPLAGYDLGQGVLLLDASSDAFGDGRLRTALDRLEGGIRPFAKEPGRLLMPPGIPGLDDVGFGFVVILLVLFSILIGPVNFSLVRSTGRPALLLVTIPVLSLAVTLFLIGHGVLSQGIDVKSASLSATVLDQRMHRAASVHVRTVFSGLAAGELELGAGTVLLPLDEGGRSYRIDETAGTRLSGDFLPARQNVPQLLVSEAPARERVELVRDGAGMAARNGLGVTIHRLLVHDSDGRWYRLAGALGPEEESDLPSVTAEDARAFALADDEAHADALGGDALARFRGLEPALADPGALWVGSYLAIVERPAFAPDGGVDTNEELGLHVVLGVFDPAELRRR